MDNTHIRKYTEYDLPWLEFRVKGTDKGTVYKIEPRPNDKFIVTWGKPNQFNSYPVSTMLEFLNIGTWIPVDTPDGKLSTELFPIF